MNNNDRTSSTVTSADGTTIAYQTLGSGAGLIIAGWCCAPPGTP